MDKQTERRFILAGWTLFIVSAVFFIVASLRSGDWISLGGAVCFLAANIVFLIPILKEKEL